MNKRITIKADLSVEQVEARYRKAEDAVERSHWQIIRLLAQGKTIAAAVAGTSTERLQHLLTDAAWDAQALDEARVKQLLAIHPPTAGVLVFDDTGLPKKGTESVG
jgi:SRSO17 transposase